MFIQSIHLILLLLCLSWEWIINENEVTSIDNWIVNITMNQNTIKEYELSREYDFSEY